MTAAFCGSRLCAFCACNVSGQEKDTTDVNDIKDENEDVPFRLKLVESPVFGYNMIGALWSCPMLSVGTEGAAMADVVVQTRENGPILIKGPITLIDHLGNVFDLTGKDSVALCRCSHSQRRPFCDGTHKTCGFTAGETVPPIPPTPTPQA